MFLRADVWEVEAIGRDGGLARVFQQPYLGLPALLIERRLFPGLLMQLVFHFSPTSPTQRGPPDHSIYSNPTSQSKYELPSCISLKALFFSEIFLFIYLSIILTFFLSS